MLNRPLSNLLSLYSIYTVSSCEVGGSGGGGIGSGSGLTYAAQWTNEAYVSRIKSVLRSPSHHAHRARTKHTGISVYHTTILHYILYYRIVRYGILCFNMV